jgi:F0F1-type ATP synthase delta subunit
MKLSLPDTIASTQDLTALLLELQQYTHWFTHQAIKQRVTNVKQSAQPELSVAAATLIRNQAGAHPLTQAQLDSLIATLSAYRDSAPTITITLAAPPTASLKTSLVAWCRANIAADILISFQFNGSLLGGMVVRYGSRVFDWSFRRDILGSRARFPEVLRRV